MYCPSNHDWSNVLLMLGHRLRCWPNIKTASAYCVVCSLWCVTGQCAMMMDGMFVNWPAALTNANYWKLELTTNLAIQCNQVQRSMRSCTITICLLFTGLSWGTIVTIFEIKPIKRNIDLNCILILEMSQEWLAKVIQTNRYVGVVLDYIT